MSDAEIGQMRNGLGLSGNQLERYQTQRSIVIKKQADLVNCSALGSLAIEKGFETTVDKLLKELLKKAAGAVGGALGGAAAISGGIVIGMLLSTEEVGESKEELDEFVRLYQILFFGRVEKSYPALTDTHLAPKFFEILEK